MAVKRKKSSTRAAIVAIISLVIACMAVPLLCSGEPAIADSATESRLLIAWEEGKVCVDSLLSQTQQDPRLEGLVEMVPGLEEELQEGSWPAPSLQSISLPEGAMQAAAEEAIEALPGVRFVEEDTLASSGDISRDPYYSEQWHLQRIGAARAWDVTAGSPGVMVAIVDSGVDAAHPELSGRVLGGYDFVEDDGDASDANGHGTHVAGIVAASGDNGVGVAGVAWRTSILPVRVLDESGYGYYSDVIAGIRYAADQSADVINLSLGGSARSQALQEAVDYAHTKGSIVVAAAGNDGLDSLSYPAACQYVIGVGASGQDDLPTSFSNRGKDLDLLAPGASIYSTFPNNRYVKLSGTSMAAPQVTGTLAMLLSVRPGLSPEDAEMALTRSATDLGPKGRDDFTGWGLLRMDRAIGLDEPAAESSSGKLFFAEGYTGPGFDTYMLLENPDSQAHEAGIELFGAQGLLYSTTVNLAPRSRLTMHINELVPPGDVAAGIDIEDGAPLRAQRSMYFDYHGLKDGHTTQASAASQEWYFAEGYTGAGFDTYILVFNPQNAVAHVDLRMMTPASTLEHSLEVAPLARCTVRLNDIMPGAEIATVLTADTPVVAERAMYFDKDGIKGGSVVMGAGSPSEEQYFAEGFTGGEFDEWLLFANPSDNTVTAITSFQRSDGVTIERETLLQPRSRATIHVDEVPGLENAEVSAQVTAAYPGVVAERAMYFTYSGSMGSVSGGHAAMGARQPSSSWCIPEGYTGSGFESWILVANLEEEAVTIRVDLLGESGTTISREFQVGPHSRYTVKENTLLPGEGVSAEVSAPDGARLIVEGAFYFNYRDDIGGGST